MPKRSERTVHRHALRSLSSLQPLYAVERSVAAIEAVGAIESFRFLDMLRMRSLVSRRLSDLPHPSPAARECLAALSAKVTSLRHMHSVLDANLARLDQVARETGLSLFGGKGIGAHAMYPDRAVRDFNDLDLFVRRHADATRLSRELRTRFGYSYQDNELPWLKLDPADGMVYGQIALVAPAGSLDMLNVDIHFGDYSVRHCGRLSITDAFPQCSPGLHLVAPEENLACIVNNAAGDYFVSAKDTNDLLLAISQPSFDMARFLALIRQARLDGFLKHIVRTLRESSALTDEQERRLRAIPITRTFEPAPRADSPSWRLRCLGTTLHAFAVRREDGVVAATKVAANAFSYYRKRLRLRVVPRGQRRHSKAPAWNPWTCIRLVPIEMALGLLPGAGGAEATDRTAARSTFVGDDKEIERFDTAAGMYFRIADEFFVGTVDYEISADVIRQAAMAYSR